MVHFYEDPKDLIEAVSSFAREGLARDECVALITIPERGDTFKGILESYRSRGKLVVFDAHSVLDRIMIGKRPDARQFAALARSIPGFTGGRPFRAFGEAVDLLARGGNFEGAILLEEMWNKLLRRQPFPLYCAYDLGIFCREMRGSEYRQVRAIHERVLQA